MASPSGTRAAITIRGPQGMRNMYFQTDRARHWLGLAAVGLSGSAGANIVTVSRPGRLSVTRVAGRKNRTITVSQLVTSQTGRHSVEAKVRQMRGLAESGVRFKITGGSSYVEGGIWWVPTAWDLSVQARSGANNISRALITWTLVEWADQTVSIRTKPKKKATSKSRKKSSAKTTKAKTTTKYITYTIKSGDSLGRIAARYLGSSAKWTTIYNLNRKAIGNPNRMKVGTKIKIPRK